MNQHKHNTLTDVDTISVSSARRYNMFIQCVLSNTFTQATHPHVSLQLSDITQPLAQYLLFFTNTNTFSHPPNFVLLCLNVYLSLPSYALSSQKSTKWTSHLEPDLSINVMVLYTVQSPLFSTRSSRKSATGAHLDRVQLELFKRAGDALGTPRPTLLVHLNSITKWLPLKVSAQPRRP